MNKHIENTIINIIRHYPTLARPINQYAIADEYMSRCSDHITPRTVRNVIVSLIEQGYPIISTPHEPGGYCWEGDSGEALACYRRLRKKGLKVLLRARRILRNYRNGQGQLSLLEKVG